jgi:tetratricopeptide (TPR) repeat protein
VQKRPDRRFLDAFIQTVHDMYTEKEVHFSIKDRYYDQLEEAFQQAVQLKDPRLKKWVYKTVSDFCEYRGYNHFFLRLSEAVEALFLEDERTLSVVYAHRALILAEWEQLGDRAGLAICWWNQGLIYEQINDPKSQARLWRKSIETNKDIGIPTEWHEKHYKELEKRGKGE